MVTMDLSHLSHGDLVKAIASHCSQFGTVANLKVVPPAKHRRFAIAIVGMSTEAESENVACSIGDMKFGKIAVIHLVQEDGEHPYL
jgi:hypothetical protein